MASSYKLHHVPVQAKGIHYRGDGTGRDGYVLQTNGGLYSKNYMNTQSRPSVPNFTKWHFGTGGQQKKYPQKSVMVNHYLSDGTGRDSYVKHDEGGGVVNYNVKRKQDQTFFNNLRSTGLSNTRSGSNTMYSHSTFGLKSGPVTYSNDKFRQQTMDSWRLSQNKSLYKPLKRDFTPRLTMSSIKKNNEWARKNELRQQKSAMLDDYALLQTRRKSLLSNNNNLSQQNFYGSSSNKAFIYNPEAKSLQQSQSLQNVQLNLHPKRNKQENLNNNCSQKDHKQLHRQQNHSFVQQNNIGKKSAFNNHKKNYSQAQSGVSFFEDKQQKQKYQPNQNQQQEVYYEGEFAQ